jgi:hypothetical protein
VNAIRIGSARRAQGLSPDWFVESIHIEIFSFESLGSGFTSSNSHRPECSDGQRPAREDLTASGAGSATAAAGGGVLQRRPAGALAVGMDVVGITRAMVRFS